MHFKFCSTKLIMYVKLKKTIIDYFCNIILYVLKKICLDYFVVVSIYIFLKLKKQVCCFGGICYNNVNLIEENGNIKNSIIKIIDLPPIDRIVEFFVGQQERLVVQRVPTVMVLLLDLVLILQALNVHHVENKDCMCWLVFQSNRDLLLPKK